MQRGVLSRSRRGLSNAYFLAKFGLGTAENEPSKVCPIERPRTLHRRRPATRCRLGPPAPGSSGAALAGGFLFTALAALALRKRAAGPAASAAAAEPPNSPEALGAVGGAGKVGIARSV